MSSVLSFSSRHIDSGNVPPFVCKQIITSLILLLSDYIIFTDAILRQLCCIIRLSFFLKLCFVFTKKKTTYIVLRQIELLETRQVANGGWKCPVEHHRRQQQDFCMPIGVSKRPLVTQTQTQTDTDTDTDTHSKTSRH